MTEFNLGGESPFSEDGSVPPVGAADFKAVWKLAQPLPLCALSEVTYIPHPEYAKVCSPGADVIAVWYRTSFFRLLAEHHSLLPPEMPEAIRDIVFNLAARFPMKAIEPGLVYNGLPLDMEEFVKQLEHDIGESQKQ